MISEYTIYKEVISVSRLELHLYTHKHIYVFLEKNKGNTKEENIVSAYIKSEVEFENAKLTYQYPSHPV